MSVAGCFSYSIYSSGYCREHIYPHMTNAIKKKTVPLYQTRDTVRERKEKEPSLHIGYF